MVGPSQSGCGTVLTGGEVMNAIDEQFAVNEEVAPARPDRTRNPAFSAVGAVLVFLLVAGGSAAYVADVVNREVPSVAPSPTVVCGEVSEILVPSCGAWLGIWPRTRADGTMTRNYAKNLADIERRLGRPIVMVSRYHGWGELPPDDVAYQWRDSGHILVVDLRARNFETDQYVQWRDIAAGRYDDYLLQVAHRVKDFGVPIFFSFNQEPEQELERGFEVAGTPEDYADAYRHIHDLFIEAGATNAIWLWWVMGFDGHTDWYPRLYPGDAYVDWISYDPYDYNECRGVRYKTPTETVTPFLDWLSTSGLGAGKPVMLSEFGSYGDNRGSWYREFGRIVKTLPRIKAVIVFNSNPGNGPCDTRVTASRDNWEGFASIASDPYFNPPLPGYLQ